MAENKKYAAFCDAHHEIMEDYIIKFFENEQDILAGKFSAFDAWYKPIFEKSGVNMLNLVVGNEHTTTVMYSNTDRYFLWDTLKKMDMLHTELEHGCDSFRIVMHPSDIDECIKEGKIAILCTLNGGIALQGKQCYSTLSSLRSLFRMGLRGVQLTTNGRNRLADGVGQSISEGKITGFGREVIAECDRLGIVLDTAQLSDYGFYDLVELTKNPVIDSHSCCTAICDFPRNISDERIKAIAKSGGVVALSFWAALVNSSKQAPAVEDLLLHVDHIIKLVGVEHLALGPEFGSFQTPVDRSVLQGYAHLGPNHEMDYQTPAQSEKYPGYIEGIWYGKRKNDFIEGATNHWTFGEIIPALEKHGLSTGDIEKILGQNFIRVYKQVLK